MTAEECLRNGDVDGALSQLKQSVRSRPDDAKLRVFLFQLLSVCGDWDRALTQLNVAGDLDAGTLAMVQTYREALRCEALRADVFAGRRTPLIFGEPEQWIALLLEALKQTADGKPAQAQPLRDEAFEAAPATPGTLLTGAENAQPQPFDWIADADTRLGPVLEAVISGRYYWVPLHRVQTIDVEPPADLRDLVWMPAHFRFVNGGETVGLIPTRYPGSQNAADDAVRLARKTEWTTDESEAAVGLGQRLLATEEGEYPLMDIRRIDLRPASGEEPAHG